MSEKDDPRQDETTSDCQTAFRWAGGSPVAADAGAPIWTACPDGKASSRFPDSGIPCTWPSTVRRALLIEDFLEHVRED
jgi:hypothetical protein